MTAIKPFFGRLFQLLLSGKTKEKSERIILYIAIASFLLHLALIFLMDTGILGAPLESKLLSSPIAAIYTPFSFILLYEVYLLVYYLPQSITTYIGKQYEIITLIIIRRLFKDLSNLEMSSDWFQIKDDLQFTYDITASVLLFFLIFVFYRLSQWMPPDKQNQEDLSPQIQRFISIKKTIAVLLVPMLLLLAIYNFTKWGIVTFQEPRQNALPLKDVNNIFFDEFFTVLILVDVVLLLFSFFHTDKFHKVMRNSGFIISTILIRLSFSTDGLINTILIITAVAFGVLVLWIHNKFENQMVTSKSAYKEL